MFDAEIINSIILVLSSIKDNEDGKLMWRIVDLIKEKANFAFVSLYLVDSKKEFAVIKSGTDSYGKRMVERGHRENIQSEKYLYRTLPRAIYFNEVALHDYYAPSPYFNSPLLPFTAWELSFPLRINNRVIGALEVNGKEKASFQIEDTLEFQKVADEVSRLLVKFGLI
jgi:hypothetical protein